MIVSESRFFINDRPKSKGVRGALKSLLWNLESILYKSYSNLFSVQIQEKKHNVSICAIFKNEAPYLKEWIEFNSIVGIDHFYMYNNNSTDNFKSILQPYIQCGLVTLIDWPHNQKQMECYQTCIKDYAGETKWLGFIDIDEFIVPKSTDSIYEFLKPFEQKTGAVSIYWKLFGTSGRLDRDITGLVSEDFTVCWPKYCDIGKCFYNTAFGFDYDCKHAKLLHHSFWANYKGKNIPPVNIFNHICVGNRHIADKGDFPIQINHYFTKSYKEYAMKRAKGDVYFKNNPHDEAYFYEHEMKCTSTDYSAYKYLIKLKLRMQQNET